MIYSVSGKKETKTFRNIFQKTLAILMKYASFLNKLAAKLYKRFPTCLNNISTLPYET